MVIELMFHNSYGGERMSLSFTPKQFIRLAPKNLLREHYNRKGIGFDIDWADISDRHYEPVLKGLYASPEPLIASICGEWRTIYNQADERGADSILQAANLVSPPVDLRTVFDQLCSRLGLSYHTWLYSPKVFDIAAKLEYADHVLFYKRTDIPTNHFVPDEQSLERLRNNLSEYFKETTDRGKGCVVDTFQRGCQYYYFCSLEDHPHTTPAFTNNHELVAQSIRPAFEVIFILNAELRTLETRAKGGVRIRSEVETVFGRSILKVDLGEPAGAGQIYNLNLLLCEDFDLTLHPDDDVQAAIVVSSKVRILGAVGSVTIDVPFDAAPHACYNLTKELVIDQLGVDRLQVVQAKFRLLLNAKDGERPKRLTFTVAHPASCSLRADPIHEVAKNLLKRWGIDETGSADYVPPQPRSRAQYRFWH